MHIPRKIIEMIQNSEAYIASDTSVKGATIGGYQYLTNIAKQDKLENT